MEFPPVQGASRAGYSNFSRKIMGSFCFKISKSIKKERASDTVNMCRSREKGEPADCLPREVAIARASPEPIGVD